MSKKEEDRALDELLRNMPKFTDHRPKEEVYMRVQKELENHRFDNKRNIQRRSNLKWLPLVVSVASVILLTFLVSSYINEETMMHEKSMDEPLSPVETNRSMEITPESANKKVSDSKEAEQANDMTPMAISVESEVELKPLNSETTAVYAGSLNGGTIFHFSFLENALSVPVTIIIPKERIDIDFPDSKPNSLQLYERYASQIDEEALGFTEYHPYKGYFVAVDKMLQHYLPKEHGYDIASGTSAPYWSSINEIFTDFDALMRLNEDGTPIEWDQAGILDEPSQLDGTTGQFNYFKYDAMNGEKYLTPNFRKRYNTISEAFVDMKQADNDFYTSVIPSEVTYSYRDDNGTPIIRFDQPLDLEALDSLDATQLIEAFTLTAASFGKEVKLENIVQEQWGAFDLTNTLPEPQGPNGFIMQTK